MSWIRPYLFISLLFVAQPLSFADYRVFRIRIEDPELGTSREEVSILDHIQYPQYYPLNKGEVIRLESSWMCYMNSSHGKKPCPDPNGPAVEPAPLRVPASN